MRAGCRCLFDQPLPRKSRTGTSSTRCWPRRARRSSPGRSRAPGGWSRADTSRRSVGRGGAAGVAEPQRQRPGFPGRHGWPGGDHRRGGAPGRRSGAVQGVAGKSPCATAASPWACTASTRAAAADRGGARGSAPARGRGQHRGPRCPPAKLGASTAWSRCRRRGSGYGRSGRIATRRAGAASRGRGRARVDAAQPRIAYFNRGLP